MGVPRGDLAKTSTRDLKRRVSGECRGLSIYSVAPYLVPFPESLSDFWRKLALIVIPEKAFHFGSLEDQILTFSAPGK